MTPLCDAIADPKATSASSCAALLLLLLLLLLDLESLILVAHVASKPKPLLLKMYPKNLNFCH